MEQPNYYAVIPAEVRYNNALTPNAKLLYGEITALANKEGICTATNRYFAELYNVSLVSVSSWVGQLAKLGYLKVTLKRKKGSKEIEERVIKISLIPHKEILNTPHKEILKDNIYTKYIDSNIYTNNNIYNNSSAKKIKTVHFTPEVVKAYDYFLELFKGEKTTPQTKPQKEKWLKTLAFIEKHYNLADAYRAIKWARKDDFWASNVLSLPALITAKNGERKLDKILAKYNSINQNNKPEPMQRIKGNWKLITTPDNRVEVQVTNQYGKTINEFLLTQQNGYSKADIEIIKNFLSKSLQN